MKPATLSLLLLFTCLGGQYCDRSGFQAAAADPGHVARPSSLIPATDGAKASSPTLRIWKVGSPRQANIPNSDVPPDLASSAAELGYNVSVEAFPAAGFAEMFLAKLGKYDEPDIVAFENYIVIRQIVALSQNSPDAGSTALVRTMLEVTGSLDTLGRGWQFLLPSSRNYQAANSLALQIGACGVTAGGQELTADFRPVVEQIAQAYFEGPQASAELMILTASM